VILACTVLIQLTSVTDRQTDGQTDRQTPRRWQRRAKHSAFARKNLLIFIQVTTDNVEDYFGGFLFISTYISLDLLSLCSAEAYIG